MLKKIVHTFGTRAFSAVSNLLLAVLLSQYLGPAGKGTQSIILTTISFILIFSNIVGGATLVYLTPRFRAGLLLVPSYAWTILMGLVSWIVLRFTNLVEGEYVLHVCVLAVINSLISIHSNILLGNQKIKESNYLFLLQSVLMVITLFIILGIFRNHSVYAYIQTLYITLSICLIVSVLYIRESFTGISFNQWTAYKDVILQLFRYGFQNQVAHITQLLSFRMSFYVLDKYQGVSAVGVFSNGISIAESIWLVSKSMAMVQYSWVSNEENRDVAASTTMKLVKAGLGISAFLIIPLLLLPVSGYVFIFGPGFGSVKPVIWSLVPGVLLYTISILVGHYYSGTGRYYRNTIISTLGLMMSAILYFTLIPLLSLSGAGLATSLSYMFTSILFLWYFARENKGWYQDLRFRKGDLPKLFREAKVLLNRKSD